MDVKPKVGILLTPLELLCYSRRHPMSFRGARSGTWTWTWTQTATAHHPRCRSASEHNFRRPFPSLITHDLPQAKYYTRSRWGDSRQQGRRGSLGRQMSETSSAEAPTRGKVVKLYPLSLQSFTYRLLSLRCATLCMAEAPRMRRSDALSHPGSNIFSNFRRGSWR